MCVTITLSSTKPTNVGYNCFAFTNQDMITKTLPFSGTHIIYINLNNKQLNTAIWYYLLIANAIVCDTTIFKSTPVSAFTMAYP